MSERDEFQLSGPVRVDGGEAFPHAMRRLKDNFSAVEWRGGAGDDEQVPVLRLREGGGLAEGAFRISTERTDRGAPVVTVEGGPFSGVVYGVDELIKPGKTNSGRLRGATWQFASAEHLAQFAADPARFAPQYGGYCAWGVNFGYTASTDPNSWAVRDGKLYLNNSAWVHAIWKLTPGANVGWADKRWQEFSG